MAELDDEFILENMMMPCIDGYDVENKPSLVEDETKPQVLQNSNIGNVCELFMIYDICKYIRNEYMTPIYQVIKLETKFTMDIFGIVVDYLFNDFKRFKCLEDGKYQNNFIVKYYEYCALLLIHRLRFDQIQWK